MVLSEDFETIDIISRLLATSGHGGRGLETTNKPRLQSKKLVDPAEAICTRTSKPSHEWLTEQIQKRITASHRHLSLYCTLLFSSSMEKLPGEKEEEQAASPDAPITLGVFTDIQYADLTDREVGYNVRIFILI